MKSFSLTDSYTSKVPFTFTGQRLADLLCGAIEGGSNYWARFEVLARSPDLSYLKVRVTEHEAGIGDRPITKVITPADLLTGIERMVAQQKNLRHLAEFMDENDDAETADVILQWTVLKDLVYG